MFQRLLKPSRSNSFFLLGARGTGKSTFVREQFRPEKCWTIDLLEDETEDRFSRNPDLLLREHAALTQKPEWVFIDEVQKVPKLLDLAQKLISEKGQKFILTGSSARKLKRGSANLLAGRAFVYNLFPFTHLELGQAFHLESYLQWGGLPQIYTHRDPMDRKSYLRSYGLTYLKEEIRQEQLVRELDPFRDFLTIASQSSGKVINFSNIARDVGVDYKTVQSYFQILEDTWLGFWLPAFHRSVRKSQLQMPKFYFFDLGLKHSLAGEIDVPPVPGNSFYGEAFEQFIVSEIFRLNEYYMKDYRISFFLTKHGTEIDLILSKGRGLSLVEIKSTDKVDVVEARNLERHCDPIKGTKKIYYVSRDSRAQKIGNVFCLPWADFLAEVLMS